MHKQSTEGVFEARQVLDAASEEIFGERVALEDSFYNLYSHSDVDGVLSNYLVEKILSSLGKKSKTTILHNLVSDDFSAFKKPFILTDLGANFCSQVPLRSYTIDHHHYEEEIASHNYINSKDKDLCTTAMVYLLGRRYFGKEFVRKFYDICLIGIYGDCGDTREGSLYLQIAKEMEALGLVHLGDTLSIYGSDRYSLSAFLKYNFDEEMKQRVYVDLGIDEDQALVKVTQLLPEDLLKLSKTLNCQIIKKPYFLKDKFLCDPQVYASLFNSSCRLDDFGSIKKFLDKKDRGTYGVLLANKKRFQNKLKDYVEIASKIETHEGEQAIYYLFLDKLDHRFCGIVANQLCIENKLALVFADYTDQELKFSLRGSVRNKDFHAGSFLKYLSGIFQQNIYSGGHQKAAGGVIPKNILKEFIALFEKEMNSSC